MRTRTATTCTCAATTPARAARACTSTAAFPFLFLFPSPRPDSHTGLGPQNRDPQPAKLAPRHNESAPRHRIHAQGHRGNVFSSPTKPGTARNGPQRPATATKTGSTTQSGSGTTCCAPVTDTQSCACHKNVAIRTASQRHGAFPLSCYLFLPFP